MNKARDPEMLSALNKKPASTAPTLPPAPTIPETEPIARGRTKGTTAYQLALQAASDLC